MVQINFGQREVSCKVVFYGPGMSGKTTNLEIIHKKAPKEAVGEMVSIATETDRTLYFDFLPLDLGQVAGMRTKFQLYTVPGQIYYNATRKLVLQGVDGVIFVADSSPEKMAENLESLQNLRDNLAEMSLNLDDVPLVLQYNKRDLPNAMSIADINAKLNPMGVPVFEGVAREGKGVFATLKEISRLVIERLNKEHAPAANRRRTNTSLTPPNSSPAAPPLRPPGQPTPAQASPLPAQAVAPAHSTTPLSQPRLPPRPAPAPAPAQRAMPPVAAHTPAHAHPTAPAPAQAAPTGGDNPRDKHLAKAKPPSLEQQRPQPQRVNLGATDPSLKKYQEAQRPGGGGVKTLLMVLIGLIILVIVLAVLVVFVPPVRALLPIELQQKLIGPPPASAPTPTPAPATSPEPAAPAPAAPAPAAAPAATAPASPASAAPAPAAPAPAPAATATPAPAAAEPAAAATVPPEQTPAQPAAAPAPAEGAHGK